VAQSRPTEMSCYLAAFRGKADISQRLGSAPAYRQKAGKESERTCEIGHRRPCARELLICPRMPNKGMRHDHPDEFSLRQVRIAIAVAGMIAAANTPASSSSGC
jgi:hypothetical protein